MPTIKNYGTLKGNSIDILNAIRNEASANYRDYIPTAEQDGSNIKEIGATLATYPLLQNEFLSALVNRIGMVMLMQKTVSNPLAPLKKGMLEYGETVEEVFVELAKPFQFDQAVAEREVFKREIPDVRSAFHILNYQKYYKSTVSADQLRQAFLSNEGVVDLIAKIVDAMYSSANYDEFLAMKYLIAKNILDGKLYPVSIPEATSANAKSIVTKIKGTSNAYEFMTTKYNLFGVHNHSPKDDQYLLINSEFDSIMDVEVLASAFNMSKAEFMGHRILVDSFGSLDMPRLNELFGDNPGYTPLTDAELEALDAIPAILIDKNWFMILDNLYTFREQENGQGLYWNYWLHVWKTLSTSPFANASVFVPGTPTVTGVTVSPSTATLSPGGLVGLTVEVATTNFASKAVRWSVSPEGSATVTDNGTVTLANDATGTVVVTATSVYDPEVSGTCTITVAGEEPGVPGITSVTVSPSTATVAISGTQQLTASVVATGGASTTVTWASSDSEKATVSDSGLVTGVAEGSATITATSTVDGTKSGSCTVTVPANRTVAKK